MIFLNNPVTDKEVDEFCNKLNSCADLAFLLLNSVPDDIADMEVSTLIYNMNQINAAQYNLYRKGDKTWNSWYCAERYVKALDMRIRTLIRDKIRASYLSAQAQD